MEYHSITPSSTHDFALFCYNSLSNPFYHISMWEVSYIKRSTKIREKIGKIKCYLQVLVEI